MAAISASSTNNKFRCADSEVPNTNSPDHGLPSSVMSPEPPKLTRADRAVSSYLRKAEPIFKDLDDLREQGWHSKKAERHFQKLRKRADGANVGDGTKFFFEMNKKIGCQLAKTGAFSTSTSGTTAIQALNLCMAPGGYTWSLLQVIPQACIYGITLPSEIGGHPMLLPFGNDNPSVEVKFMDITMLAVEFGTALAKIPAKHPEATEFSAETPYQGLVFDIVLCDGQVLRTHRRAEYRQDRESFRLTISQLIFGMKRIKVGGTLIILLHKVDAWNTIKLLKAFDTFSKIELFKPEKIHGKRSSFYLIAKDVQPDHAEAIKALENWKNDWWMATFAGEECTGELQEDSEETVYSLLNAFGPKLVGLGTGIWSIQLKALREASF